MQIIFISDLLPKSSTPERPSNHSSETTDPRGPAFNYVIKYYQYKHALGDEKVSLENFIENREFVNNSVKVDLLKAYDNQIKNVEDLIQNIISLFSISDSDIICYADKNLIEDELGIINEKYEAMVEEFDQSLSNLRCFS